MVFRTLEELYYNLSIPVASIAIGITEAALEKAVEYAKVRSAFNHYLKDFQPLAFDVAELTAERKRFYHFLKRSCRGRGR